MKIVKFATLIILITGLFIFSLVACNLDGGSTNSGRSTPQPGDRLADHLTATFGADQFHIQLTAIAVNQAGNLDKQSNTLEFGTSGQSLLTGGAAGP